MHCRNSATGEEINAPGCGFLPRSLIKAYKHVDTLSGFAEVIQNVFELVSCLTGEIERRHIIRALRHLRISAEKWKQLPLSVPAGSGPSPLVPR